MNLKYALLIALIFNFLVNGNAQHKGAATVLSAKPQKINSIKPGAPLHIPATNTSAFGGNDELCSNWLQINDEYSAFQIGDLDVTGQTVTVEALFNRIAINPLFSDSAIHGKGEIVSKHSSPDDANYLLRADRAQVTTTNGHFVASSNCDLPLNKTYHVALVYDGKTLKFYRNGFLLSSTPCTGNLITNDFKTLVGNYAYSPGYYNEDLMGYINEVRIWNIARTQDEIRTYMNASLTNPKTQNGLLAYYTFDDLKNKQGNSLWDGKLILNAQINQTNPTCNSFIADSCNKIIAPTYVIANFTAPDTVCVNTPVHITNTTIGASNNYWSFCTADLKNTLPEGTNLGNVEGALSQPVFMDLVSDNGKYYAFLTNHYPGGLVRLDFGNSYLNIPTTTSFGNFGGIIPAGYGTEGIQVVKNDGKWYAIVVAGSAPNNIPSRIIKIELGISIENPSPVATDWGNIGNLSSPIDFYMFSDKDQWYGFIVNALNNTISRIAFTNSFDNIPTGTNLGNVDNMLNYPTGVHAINNEGNWSLFVTNAESNKLVRLDFGKSLLNVPAATDLGNFNNILNAPRDITIIKSCESTVGYIVNGKGNDIVQLDFNNDFNNVPVGKSLGDIGDLSFPHSISKLFRVNNDVYSFITNVNNNTITRLKFAGCNNASIGGSSLQNPPDVLYNKPGTYNITLAVDEGLATQSSVCRQVVVLAPPEPQPAVDTAFCDGSNINLISLSTGKNYVWNTGATTSNITVAGIGKYWVTTDAYGCKSTDSFYVSKLVSPIVVLGNDTALCKGDSLIVLAKNAGSSYLWQDGSKQDSLKINAGGMYAVAVTNPQGCVTKDTIQVNPLLPPVLSGLGGKTICKDDAIELAVIATGTNNIFNWQPDATLSALNIANPVAAPDDTTQYYLAVKNESGCIAKDSISVNVVLRPSVIIRTDTIVCKGDPVTLTASVANATVFIWSPSKDLSDRTILSPVAKPTATTTYSIAAGNGVCSSADEMTINVLQLPVVTASNDTTVCGVAATRLSVSGAKNYTWFPDNTLSNATIPNPVATPSQTIVYHVKGKDDNGCVNEDSVQITVAATPVFAISPADSKVCSGDSILVTSSGGDIYDWDMTPDILQSQQASTFIKPLTNNRYKVVVTNTTCKLKDTLYTNLSIAEKPLIQVTYSNDLDCTVNSAVLNATGASSYSWTPASTLSNSNFASPVAMPGQTTSYHVKATGANGCIAEDSLTVIVKIANSEHAYQIPSAFTPNNDGINDCFGVKKWSLVNNLDFAVYDRWGASIFHGNKLSDCWDGNYKGLPQAAGTYIYVIKAKTFCGDVYKKGTVVLIR